MDQQSDSKRLIRYIDRFPEVKLLVVGDVMVDQFIWGDVRRISPEAPVPVVEVEKDALLLGGAANVLHNVVSLGGKAELFGLIGPDEMGRKLVHLLRKINCGSDGLVVEHERPTSIKTRVIARGQQVVRFDREKRIPASADSIQKMIALMRQRFPEVRGIILSDYGKGLVTGEFMKALRRAVTRQNLLVAVDPKRSDFNFYRGATLITPNKAEAETASGIKIKKREDLRKVAETLRGQGNFNHVLITLGEEGMALLEEDGTLTFIPTVAREVYDVSGAGDTVIATMALSVASGLTIREACEVANYAAGIVVVEVGTATVTPERLKEEIRKGAR